MGGPAFAQLLPGSADPGRTQQRFQPEPQTRTTTDQVVPLVEPERQVPGDAARIRFVLSSVTVAGSTVYDGAALAATYGEFVGKEISLADAQTIADRITVKYRNDGYILSRAVVPAQRISVRAINTIGDWKEMSYLEGNWDQTSATKAPSSGSACRIRTPSQAISSITRFSTLPARPSRPRRGCCIR